MESRYSRKDFSQLAAPPSSNFKWAGSGSGWTSHPHKARGITEVSNRNTISKDSTQRRELCAFKLRNRDTISKDLTQRDGSFKPEMQNRAATLKNKIENDNPRITALGPGDSLNPPIDVDISELWRSLDEDHKSDFHSKPVQLNRRPAVPDWDSMQTDFTKPFPMGAISPNASPGLYAVHQPSPAQQQQYLQQRFNMNNPRA